jgi:large subunit ribosomal protein L10
MNRDQKAVAIADIAAKIDEANAIFAVDYRGITVPDAAELRARLRESEASFKVVKNSLTERAADQAGAEALKEFLTGPTALTFVRGDVATAAKAIADYTRATQLLPFKGGLLDGATLDADQIRSISRLPSRDVLYGQLVGVVASPVSGLVRTLGALVGGLAVALGQVREKKESGEIDAGPPPAASAETPAAADLPAAEAPAADEAPAAEAPAAETPAAADAPAAEAPAADEPAAEAPAADEPEPQAQAQAGEPEAPADADADAEATTAEAEPTDQAEPAGEPAKDDDNPDDPDPAEAGSADLNPTKED